MPRVTTGEVGRPPAGGAGRPSGLGLLTIGAAIGLGAILWTLPSVLVLPAVSLLLVAGGLTVAAAGALTRVRRHAGSIDAYDVAGACLLVGFTAALVSDVEAVLALTEQWLAQSDRVVRR